jgi:hypothetical protein
MRLQSTILIFVLSLNLAYIIFVINGSLRLLARTELPAVVENLRQGLILSIQGLVRVDVFVCFKHMLHNRKF